MVVWQLIVMLWFGRGVTRQGVATGLQRLLVRSVTAESGDGVHKGRAARGQVGGEERDGE